MLAMKAAYPLESDAMLAMQSSTDMALIWL
jgi:hypothetical protein